MPHQDKIEEIMTEFDIKQRLFLNGRLHSTEFNKWMKPTLLSLYQQGVEDGRKETFTVSVRTSDANTCLNVQSSNVTDGKEHNDPEPPLTTL